MSPSLCQHLHWLLDTKLSSPQESTWEALGGFQVLLKGSRAGASIGGGEGEVQRGSATVTVFSEGVECSCFLSLVLPSLLDRLGDSKDSVREQDQTLLLKIMEQAANPQVCSTPLHSVSDWLCKKRKPFSVRFSLPFFCLKWLHLPTPCYKIFALLGKAVA